eukprot:31089-Rhodomonas_salina.1
MRREGGRQGVGDWARELAGGMEGGSDRFARVHARVRVLVLSECTLMCGCVPRGCTLVCARVCVCAESVHAGVLELVELPGRPICGVEKYGSRAQYKVQPCTACHVPLCTRLQRGVPRKVVLSSKRGTGTLLGSTRSTTTTGTGAMTNATRLRFGSERGGMGNREAERGRERRGGGGRGCRGSLSDLDFGGRCEEGWGLSLRGH